MKKLLLLFIIVGVFTSCKNDANKINYAFSDKSELRIFRQENVKSSSSSGLFVVALGTYSSQETIENFTIFYAKAKNNCFYRFKTDSKNVNFSFNDSIKTPYVKFSNNFDCSEIYQQMLENDYITATIYCKSEQIPQNLIFNF